MVLYHINCAQSVTEISTLAKSKDTCLQILSKLHTAREKIRQSYNDTLVRTITNLIMYLDVMKPRAFDSDELVKELPIDTLLSFAFQQFEEKASENGKLMIKDIRDIKLNDTIKAVEQICQLIKKVLIPTESQTIYIPQSGAGIPKKGMPGFTQYITQVEINIAEIIKLLLFVIDLEPVQK